MFRVEGFGTKPPHPCIMIVPIDTDLYCIGSVFATMEWEVGFVIGLNPFSFPLP